MTDPTEQVMPGVPRAARVLGLSGLIPFVGLAVLTLAGGPPWTAGLLAGYGAVILSFMGGCRWGFAAAGLGQGAVFAPLAISVLPSLFAWLAVWLPDPFQFLALAAGFVGLYLADRALTEQGGAPVWWPALRFPLTLGATVSLVLAALA